MRPGARFCPRCGGALGEPEEAGADAPPPLPPPGAEPPAIVGPAGRVARTPGFAALDLWRRFRPVLWLFALLLAVSAAGAAASALSGSTSPVIDVAVTVLDAVIILAFVWTERESITPALRRHGLGGRTPLVMAGLLAGLAVFMFLYLEALRAVGFPIIEYLADFEEHSWPLWSAFVLVSLCPAIFEELCFRGFIQGRLEGILGPGEAIGLQAALFSIVHLSPVILVSHFVMGLIFGWLRRRTGSLYPGMILHGTWNALVLVEEMLTAA
jgi:membrane protease YdiL (CAAX protease family)